MRLAVYRVVPTSLFASKSNWTTATWRVNSSAPLARSRNGDFVFRSLFSDGLAENAVFFFDWTQLHNGAFSKPLPNIIGSSYWLEVKRSIGFVIGKR